jgi:hypothetical protein
MGGTFNDTVNSFASHTETFTPPRGKKWQVIAMRLLKGFPAGGASGVHSFSAKQGGAAMLRGESVFGTDIDWNTNRWSKADSAQAPASDSAALMALHGITADTENPLIIIYSNATDVQNAKIGEITIHVLESPII